MPPLIDQIVTHLMRMFPNDETKYKVYQKLIKDGYEFDVNECNVDDIIDDALNQFIWNSIDVGITELGDEDKWCNNTEAVLFSIRN